VQCSCDNELLYKDLWSASEDKSCNALVIKSCVKDCTGLHILYRTGQLVTCYIHTFDDIFYHYALFTIRFSDSFVWTHSSFKHCAGLVVAAALNPQPGERVLDACAAPGGKTMFCASRMQGKVGLCVPCVRVCVVYMHALCVAHTCT
jgi:hypothetical protein